MTGVQTCALPISYRGLGIGSRFIEHVKKTYAGCVIRLEVEEENERAVKVYEKNGFHVLPYMEMITNE